MRSRWNRQRVLGLSVIFSVSLPLILAFQNCSQSQVSDSSNASVSDPIVGIRNVSKSKPPADWLVAPAGAAIETPRPDQIWQRGADSRATIPVSIRNLVGASRATIVISQNSAQVLSKTVNLAASGSTISDVNLPAGANYKIDVDLTNASGSTLRKESVSGFGIGDIFVTGGQSNSSFAGDIDSAVTLDPLARLVTVEDGMIADTELRKIGSSPWPYFLNQWVAKTKLPAMAVMSGVGGTPVHYWNKTKFTDPDFPAKSVDVYDSVTDKTLSVELDQYYFPRDLYNVVKRNADGSLATDRIYKKIMRTADLIPGRSFRAFLWHQGESDTWIAGLGKMHGQKFETLSGLDAGRSAAFTANYSSRLATLIEDVYSDFGLYNKSTGALTTGRLIPDFYVASVSYYGVPGSGPCQDQLSADGQVVVRKGQGDTLVGLPAALKAKVRQGPDTDQLSGDMRRAGECLHFSLAGTKAHGALWAQAVDAAAAPAIRTGFTRPPLGSLDHCDDKGACYGWGFSFPEAGALKESTIRVRVDDQDIAVTSFQREVRPDVLAALTIDAAAKGPLGQLGYRIQLPASALNGQVRKIQVFAEGASVGIAIQRQLGTPTFELTKIYRLRNNDGYYLFSSFPDEGTGSGFNPEGYVYSLYKTSAAPFSTPLYRCRSIDVGHFLSADSGCDGRLLDGPLGFMTTAPTGSAVALVEFFHPTYKKYFYTTVQAEMDAVQSFGYNRIKIVGYVRIN